MNDHTEKTENKSKILRRVVLLLATVVTALAVAVTCALAVDTSKTVTVGEADIAQGDQSANYSNLTGDALKNYISTGGFTNGNYVDYTYNGSYYTINLPTGTYKFEVWGGRGGYTGQYAANSGNANGGLGGYATGTITYTAASTTLYIYVGGCGAGGTGGIDQSHVTRSGGYNGGGYGIGSAGSGGGGGTDFRTSTSYTSRILIAGGGGGGGSTGITQAHSSSGSQFYGASGCTSRHNYRYYNDEGGGGGGYYGGAVRHSDDAISSYAGSNYVSGIFSNATNRYGDSGASGNGRARITAVNVNQAPVSNSRTITLPVRGATVNNAVAANYLASDKDYANNVNAAVDKVYFTDGKTGNYDEFTKGPNDGLYVDAACSKTASEYFGWGWSGNTSFTINSIKKYPRAGYDGCTTNGTITLYAKVRDNFGTSSASRGISTISFNVTVPANTISRRANGADNAIASAQNNNKLHFGISSTADAPGGSGIDTTNIYNPLGVNRYTAVFEQPLRYNDPVTIKASDLVLGDINGAVNGNDMIVASLSSVTDITGAGRKYLLEEYDSRNTKELNAYNASRTKLSNVYDTLTFKCVTPDPAYQVFTVTVYQVEKNPISALGLQNVEANVSPNAGGKTAMTVDIVFKMDNTRPVLRNDLVDGPVVSVNTLDTTHINLNDYYKDIDGLNSKIDSASHQIREVAVPTYEYVQANKYGEFISTQNTENGNNSYFNVLPADIADGTFENVLENGQLNGDKFVTGFENWYITDGNANTDIAYIQYSFADDRLTLTGLRATYSMYRDGRTNNSAITGGTVSQPETGTGVQNAGHFYILLRVQDKNDTSDSGIWLPLGVVVNNAAPHAMDKERSGAGSSVMPNADGDQNDTFYFTPMGITINQQVKPIGYRMDGGQLVSGGLRPLAADPDNYYTENMLNGQSMSAPDQTDVGKLNELIRIKSSITDLQSNNNVANNAYYFSVEFIDIYIPQNYFGARVSASFGDRVVDNDTFGKCVVVKGIKIKLKNWTHNRYLHLNVVMEDSTATPCPVQIAIKVSNIAPDYLDGSNVAQLSYKSNGVTITSNYSKPTQNEQGAYESVATIKYQVPVYSTFIVSPYDLLWDANTPLSLDRLPNKSFTLNGLSGSFGNGVFTVGGSGAKTVKAIATSDNKAYNYSNPDYTANLFDLLRDLQDTRTFAQVSTDNRFATAPQSGATTDIDRLYFARKIDDVSLDGFAYSPYADNNRNDFVDPEIAGRDFISYAMGSRIERTVDNSTVGYNVDYAVITALKRTVSGSPAVLEFSVRDRTGSAGQGTAYGIKKIRVEIEVINSSPRVQYPDKYFTLTTNPIQSKDISDLSNNAEHGFFNDKIMPSTITIYAKNDVDTDYEKNVDQNFLIDNEDTNVYFDVFSGFQVKDDSGSESFMYTKDGVNRTLSYNGNFVDVSLTANSITVTALNSTQAVKELYIIFFATDGRYGNDGRLETAECKIRIEVINAAVQYNTGDNGFVLDSDYHVWNVESVTVSDMSRERYFVSGADAATAVRDTCNASAAQIKYVTADSDKLQGVVISAATSPSSVAVENVGYVNAVVPDGADNAAVNKAYKKAVPRLGWINNWSLQYNDLEAAAIGALISMRDGNNFSLNDLEKNVSAADIIYFVKNGNVYEKYSATDLINNDEYDFSDTEFRNKFFDENGRWKVAYWAVSVTPVGATSAGTYINLRLSMRDETLLGGDTAGMPTANKAGIGTTTVFGSRMLNYSLFVNGMGIVPYTYYNQFEGYYTVTDSENSAISYVPTYDGSVDSQFKDAAGDKLYYDTDNKVITNASGDKPALKDRGETDVDKTNAGVHSGVTYSADVAKSADGYTYPVYEDNKKMDGKAEQAFRYSDTIHVSGNRNECTYVPMSYFALNRSVVSLIDASFPNNAYVSYDVGDDDAYVRKYGYETAVTISDGVNEWNGNQNNPYVEISGYDVYKADDLNDADVKNFASSPYLNKCISVPTYNGSNTADFMSNVYDTNGNLNEDLAKHIVGDNGQLLYLADQTDINKGLQEHLFGLKIQKKYTRAQSALLTITVKVVMSSANTTGDGDTRANRSGTSEGGSSATKNQATVSFKLIIDNSPIELVSTNNVVTRNNNVGYYVDLKMKADSQTQTIALSRDSVVDGANKVIMFADEDIAYKMNGDGKVIDQNGEEIRLDVDGNFVLGPNQTPARDDTKSDKARFVAGSLRQFMVDGDTGYERVVEYTGANDSITLTNVSSKEHEQKSIKNYFNAWSAGAVNTLKNSAYTPNGGIYGVNGRAGYERYFSVAFSQDYTSIAITPNAKTFINPEVFKDANGKNLPNSVIKEYYEQRGLKLITDSRPSDGAYYPLKVLIYDDHGDGFGAGSYVAVEIRVVIEGTSAKLSDNLEDAGYGDGGKKIDVSLAIDSPYSLNLSHVILGGGLLKDDENNIFWKADYDKLKEKVAADNYADPTEKLNDMFSLETGIYLQSPFANESNIQNYSNRPDDLDSLNKDLRDGKAKYSTNPGQEYGASIANLADVIMYMNYTRPDNTKGVLIKDSVPASNNVYFRVNRRTTYKVTENNATVSKQQNSFTFELNLLDNLGTQINTLYINIDVINQAPSILSSASSVANNLTMQVGDKFTVLTTPYNKFVGSVYTDNTSAVIANHSSSARNSNSYDVVVNKNGGVGEANLLDRNAAVPYEELNENNLKDKYKLHSYDPEKGSNQNLGYVAIANDDMPWGLRIENVAYYNSKCFEVAKYRDVLKAENGEYNSKYCLDAVIEAKAICTNMPITITLVDADQSRLTYTIYVTVVSSKPIAIAEGDKSHALNSALKQVGSGVYSMYMISKNVADVTDTKNSVVTAQYKNVKVGESNVKAYGFARLPINEIAYDPDSGDVPAMYNEVRSNDEQPYNVVSLNNSPMTNEGNNVYSNDIFKIEIAPDFTWFTIECKTYNPHSDEDVLRFYVRDSGNPVFENAILIEIRICTLYSSITNDAQMTNTAIRLGQFQSGAIASVDVKSFDDYSGISVGLPEDEEELNKIKDVDSTFQFLEYPGMKPSVDQTESNAKPIRDPDIINSELNRNYELRIYAFLNKAEDSESEFSAMTLDNISSLFDLSPAVVSKRVLALKSDDVLKENGVDINKYLIGGSYSDGIAIPNVNRALIMFLQRYFIFDVGDDGLSLTFRPVSANHGVDIPIYVQIEKNIGNRRAVSINGVDTVCGDIFYVNVKDSAPIVNDSEQVLNFSGKVGDSVVFKLYDKNDPFGSLFNDSDLNDTVVYDGFVSQAVQTPDYNKAFVNAGDLDWRAIESISKPQAVEISVNDAKDEVKITIKRRIDVKDKDGNYLTEVKLPIMIYGKDRGGLTASVEVNVTICNSDIDLDRSKIVDVTPDPKNGYYRLSADADNERLYYIDAYIVPGKTIAPFYFVDRQNSYISDPDFTRMSTDTDSLRLVGAESATSESYLMYGKSLSVRSEKEVEPVATVTPIFGLEGVMPDDEYHFAGFSIEAHTYNREIDDATATMRIIDRSGLPDVKTNGFTVTVRIHILNAPPQKKVVDNKPFVVTGSDTANGAPIVIDINDYITDMNNDPIRIVGLAPVYNDNPELENLHCVLDSESAGDLVEMAISEDQTKCTFTPKAGFYGEQSIRVSVADIIGESASEYAVEDFIVKFVIGYDISSVKLNDIKAIRSLPTKVSVDKLFNNIKDTFGIKDHETEQPGEFNPGNDYVITDLSASGVRVYRDGDDWMFVGDKVVDQVKFNVTFNNKVAPEESNSVLMTFNAIIEKNAAPKLLEDFKNHSDEGYLFQTSTSEYGLDNNGTVTLTPAMLFTDDDIISGDRMMFDAKAMAVSAPTICSVRVSEDGSLLYLTFNCRGECDVTVGVMDRTGETIKYTFKVKNIDRPEPSFWNKIVISYEVYPLIWWGIGIGVLVFIALLILIILLVKRRKRKREELEAILISEMELEEQMMRLNAGAMGAAPYQSYGFLPPTMNVQNDPNLMLGSGGDATDPGAIGLNPGKPGDNGVSTDSDM